ncbi:hypothetical protein BJY04DRAFT_232227 [Aspergillus karnatakaensis]|uniref:NAD(P)-dependent alcohol dehydrogenase n=1 Tax=Aspergillus karnatakaensis TaxID=1810916 RepID=UPI003CCD5B0C
MSSNKISTLAYVVDTIGAPFTLRRVVLDDLQLNEVLVEMQYTGLCHTDLVVQKGGMPCGSFPCVLGHEGLGVVKNLPDTHSTTPLSEHTLKLGDTVVLSFRTCQQKTCLACQTGHSGRCPQMTSFNFLQSRLTPSQNVNATPITLPDGTPVHGQFFGQSSLSKLAVVDRRSCVKIASDIPPPELAFLAPLGCGYLTGAGTILNVLKPEKSTKLAILGVGAVGLAALLAAKALGVREVIAVDMVGSKLDLARSFGASYTINTRDVPDLEAVIQGVFPEGVDQILDTTGVTALLQSSVKVLNHAGVLALVGVPRPGQVLEVDPLDLLLYCKRIVGVIEGNAQPMKLIPQLVEWYRAGKFPVERIATVYPASKLGEALDALEAGKVIKPVISWTDV